MTAAVEASGLTRTFGGGRTLFGRRLPAVHAVQSADLTVEKGETLGIVGESGCGKTTLARMLVGLDRPTAGTIRLEGRDVTDLAGSDPRALAKQIQYVFQDPVASLNPRKTIRQTLEAPMIRLRGLGHAAREAKLSELLAAVGLRTEFLERYPHEFSGGQAQRIGIARALAAEARVIVLDEPVSALDVSVQGQVLNLLGRLKAEVGLTYIFISHDLSVIESVCGRVAVMYFGQIVEIGRARDIYARPRHHYTALLMRSAPSPGLRRSEAEEQLVELPDPLKPPSGCAFASRCPRTDALCRQQRPPLHRPVARPPPAGIRWTAMSNPLEAPPSRPASRRRRQNSISEQIKEMIVERGLRPGDRLPAERALMASFGASKGSVREALSALRSQGLIRTRTGPGGGVFLAEIGAEQSMSLLSNYFFFRTPTIIDVYAVRCELEPELAASLAGRLSDNDFAKLEGTMRIYDALPRTAEEDYHQRMAELDFHSVLAAICPNPALGFICRFLQKLLREMTVCRRIYDLPHPELRDTALHYQIPLMRALRTGDAEAARRIMAHHMAAARDYMVSVEARIDSGFLRGG